MTAHTMRTLMDECTRIIKNQRDNPRFIGRRSLDKTHGEVIEIDGYHQSVYERIELPNFEGEKAAAERAEELNDKWTAAQILALASSSQKK